MTYTYNSDNTLANKVDAKNQKVEYVYDSQQRVTLVRRYPVNGGAEDTCQQVNYSYDANPYRSSVNVVGRLAAVQWGHETACSQGRFTEMYGYTAAGLATAKTLRLSLMNGHQTFVHDIELTASYGYNNEGKLTSMGQPGYHTGPPGAAQWTNGEQYTWSYDSMGRLNSVQEISPANASVISGISYNAANQMTQINYGTGQVQTRTYNERLQMTRMTVAGVMDLEYRYSATQNNGQITSMKNYVSGEEVNYTYDSLKRLVSAVTTGPEWGQAYGLDGFGNLLSKTVTTGSAPTWSVAVDGTTNRVVGYGYDANGNTTSIPGFTLSYDVENRLVQAVLGGVESYGYGPDNKRVWRTKASGDTEFYFYGLGGERQGIYRVGVVNGFNGVKGFFRVTAESVIPKGMQVDRDRLGSVVSGGLKYDPYGAEFTVTANDRDKFGTYYRDSNTGFNYADQRYYGSSGGRFLTPDPSVPGDLDDPQSFNLYSYVLGDPVNHHDPEGLDVEKIDIVPSAKPTCLGQFMTRISSAPNAWLNSDVGTMALQVYFEWKDADTPAARNMWNSLANVYRNRWHLSNADKRRFGFTTAGFKPLIYQSAGPQWNKPGTAQYRESHWAPNGKLKTEKHKELVRLLSLSPDDRLCQGLLASFEETRNVYADKSDDPTDGAIFYVHTRSTVEEGDDEVINPFKLPKDPILTYIVGPVRSAGGLVRKAFFYRPAP